MGVHVYGTIYALKYEDLPHLLFFTRFTKGHNFCDFLFASLDDKTLPKGDLLFNSIAVRTTKTLGSFSRSDCKMVKERICIQKGGTNKEAELLPLKVYLFIEPEGLDIQSMSVHSFVSGHISASHCQTIQDHITCIDFAAYLCCPHTYIIVDLIRIKSLRFHKMNVLGVVSPIHIL